MALAATTVWEVRTSGSDDNGGGYKSDAGTTDYSQQDAAQLTVTDGATSGIGATTLTSATGGFTAAMVGDMVHLYSGTNLTDGWYEITAYTNTNTVTLDRAPDDGVGAASAIDVKVGGCFATPGRLGKTLLSHAVTGMRAWIKAGTYTLSTSTDGPGGPFDLGSVAASLVIEGYESTRGDLGTAPVLNAGAQTGIILWSTVIAGNNHTFTNLKADGNSGAGNNGFYLKYGSARAYKCETVDCPTYGFYGVGLDGGQVLYCKASGSVFGFALLRVCNFCATVGGGRGFQSVAQIFNCIAHSATDYGFYPKTSNAVMVNCTADGDNGDTNDGFYLDDTFNSTLVNCLATNCGGYGFNFTSAAKAFRARLVKCAAYNNTSGNINNQAALGLNIGFVTLMADPYEAIGSDDFRPNSAAGGGDELKGAGVGVGSLLFVDNFNIGATRHADYLLYGSEVQSSRYRADGRLFAVGKLRINSIEQGVGGWS